MGRIPTLAISEIFGPTFQGEGYNIGTPCVFLRLAGCNLKCVWCDTPYTWDWEHYDPKQEIHPMSLESVYQQLQTYSLRHLVITGGEPMLQQKVLLLLSNKLREEGWYLEIETAGTVLPISFELADHYNISPKLSTSGNPLLKRYKPEVLKGFKEYGKVAFKFVVTCIEDFEEIDHLVDTLDLSPVYIMPEGKNTASISPEIWQATLQRKYYLTTRLHIMAYGNRRKI